MEVDKNAKIVWDYMHMNQTLERSDAIFVLGNLDTRVANYAAELYIKSLAEWMIIAGGSGRLTRGRFGKSEARIFADIIIAAGVPESRIILEEESTNTGENIVFTYNLLKEKKLNPSSLILVQKPYMERRVFATFKKQWPNHRTTIKITSPKIDYENYFTPQLNKDLVINTMVGDLQRIREYPKLGFQIEQEIPIAVWAAYENLVRLGFTQSLIK